LVKGGHAEGNALVDALAWPDGRALTLSAQRIPGIDTHGSGCTLSAAITAHLARGETLERAVILAHAYLQDGMSNPLQVVGLKHIKH
jgi:hydroxymethylpyrimidine/phosphomethylpyrimidine kinase